MQRRYFQPAVVGGVVIGVLSALPIVSAGNVCCCLWVIVGGVAASYLLQQGDADPITAWDGALVGLMAGAIGAFCYLLVSIPVTILVSPLERALLERLSDARGSMPPELRGYMDGAAGAAVRLALGFLFMLVASPAFGALGGLLGAALFRKSVPVRAGAAGTFHPTVPSSVQTSAPGLGTTDREVEETDPGPPSSA